MIIKRICEICSNEFQTDTRKVKGLPRFCSRKCIGEHFHNIGHKPPVLSGSNNGHWVEPVRLICSQCGKEFERKPWQVKRVNHGKSNFKIGKFCSNKCRLEYMAANMRGTRNPDYVGGKISYYGVRWIEARDRARERDGFRCQLCKRKRRNIHVHHVISYKAFITAEKANLLSNLICLCNKCHPKVTHNKLAVTPRLL